MNGVFLPKNFSLDQFKHQLIEAAQHPLYKLQNQKLNKIIRKNKRIDVISSYLKLPPLQRTTLSKNGIWSPKISSIFSTFSSDQNGNQITLPFSKKDYAGMINFETKKLKLLGLKKNSRSTVLYFPDQHTIPISQAIMNLNSYYIPIEGPEEIAFRKIIDNKIDFLFTTISTVNKFINFVQKNGLRPNLKIVNTGGEKISDYHKMKIKIKENLGAMYVDNIGSAILQHTAIMCKKNLYHFLNFDQIIEIVNPETGEHSNKEGEIVITPLWKTNFPLLRFRTGDYIKIENDKKHNCNFQFHKPVFKKIARRVDTMFTLNGKLTSSKNLIIEVTKNINIHFLKTNLIKITDMIDFKIIIYNLNNQDEVLVLFEKKFDLFFNFHKIENLFEKNFYILPKIKFVNLAKINNYKLPRLIDLRLSENNFLKSALDKYYDIKI